MKRHVGIKSGENHKFEFHSIIKRDSEGYFNIFFRLFYWHIYLPSMEPTWSWLFFRMALSNKTSKNTNVFGLVFLKDKHTSLVGIFFLSESFIPLSWTTSADSAALQHLCIIFNVFIWIKRKKLSRLENVLAQNFDSFTSNLNITVDLQNIKSYGKVQHTFYIYLVDFIFCIFSNVRNNVRFMAHHTS